MKVINIDNLEIKEIRIVKNGNNILQAIVIYNLLEQTTGDIIAEKKLVKFSSNAPAAEEEKLPVNFETKFNTLISDIESALITLEGI